MELLASVGSIANQCWAAKNLECLSKENLDILRSKLPSFPSLSSFEIPALPEIFTRADLIAGHSNFSVAAGATALVAGAVLAANALMPTIDESQIAADLCALNFVEASETEEVESVVQVEDTLTEVQVEESQPVVVKSFAKRFFGPFLGGLINRAFSFIASFFSSFSRSSV